MPRRKFPQKEEGCSLTLSELCDHDDIATDALLDHAYYHPAVRKCKAKYTPMRSVTETEVLAIIYKHVITQSNPTDALAELLSLRGLSVYIQHLHTSTERERFKSHLLRYIVIYMSDCLWEVSHTNRYTVSSSEASVIAREPIPPGPITYLIGVTVEMTDAQADVAESQGHGLSVMVSARTKATCVMLGPARFVNHDCSPNAVIQPGQEGIQIVALRHIMRDEEITVRYSGDYFGPNNVDCLCQTCEKLVSGGWNHAPHAMSRSGIHTKEEALYRDVARVPSEYMQVRRLLAQKHHTQTRDRQPGDYTLTNKLLVYQYDRWTKCRNECCGHNFVQQEGFLVRSECPRCERHRKVFGSTWPSLLSSNRLKEQIIGGNDIALATQGRCGKGSWVIADTEAEAALLPPYLRKPLNTFVSASDARKTTRQGQLWEADLARLRGKTIDERFTGNVESTRKSSRLR